MLKFSPVLSMFVMMAAASPLVAQAAQVNCKIVYQLVTDCSATESDPGDIICDHIAVAPGEANQRFTFSEQINSRKFLNVTLTDKLTGAEAKNARAISVFSMAGAATEDIATLPLLESFEFQGKEVDSVDLICSLAR